MYVLESHGRCAECEKLAPCVRCQRSGRPIGRMTAYGPVCNSCQIHFVEPQKCARCSRLTKRLRRLPGAEGDAAVARVCVACAEEHRTCSSCRKHRRCDATPDGRWLCGRCATLGPSACLGCGASVARGAGGRCDRCYWTEKVRIDAQQLSPLVKQPAARQAFEDFSSWMVLNKDPKRAALSIARHVEFFVRLSALKDLPWEPDHLLKHFGTAELRKFELPVRWLRECRGLAITAGQKLEDAERRRLQAQLDSVTRSSPAYPVLEAFHARLCTRRDSGEMTTRSARMSLRPAVDFMRVNPSGRPSQRDLEQYLSGAPGQRACLSLFVRHLREVEGVDLEMPGRRVAKAPAPRRIRTEQDLRELLALPERPVDFEQRWLLLALVHFHRMSKRDAKKLLKEGQVVQEKAGYLVQLGASHYAIPDPTPGLLHQQRTN